MAATAPQKLVIFGAGTLARLAHRYFARDTAYQVVAFTVDNEYASAVALDDLPIVSFDSVAESHPAVEHSMFVAVGYTQVNRRRAEIFDRCRQLGYQLPTLVSSHARCWDDLRIGSNCLVFDGVVIEPGVEIGDDVIIWSGSQISHDCVVGSHCFLGPHAVVLGDVTVGARTFIGGNATIKNGIAVGADCVIGAGALVKSDTAPGEVYSAESTRPYAHVQSREVEL